MEKNVLGEDLQICSIAPQTGFYRDGCCRTGPDDRGIHVVCAQVTQAFLDYTKAQGNDLSTPTAHFPGLKAGDRWCLCASRWLEAKQAGVAPPVILSATHSSALKYIPLHALQQHQC